MKERAEHSLSVQQMRQKYEQATRAGDVSNVFVDVVFGLHVPSLPSVPSKMHYTIADAQHMLS